MFRLTSLTIARDAFPALLNVRNGCHLSLQMAKKPPNPQFAVI
jgi:hypothetical protein